MASPAPLGRSIRGRPPVAAAIRLIEDHNYIYAILDDSTASAGFLHWRKVCSKAR